MLEDSEIGDTDIVLVEFKIGGKFKFMNEKLDKERLKNCCGTCKKFKMDLAYCECLTVKNILTNIFISFLLD